MKVSRFRNSLNDDIIERYRRAMDIYDRNIRYIHAEIKRSNLNDKEIEKLLLFMKANLLKKKKAKETLLALKTRVRKKDVFDYTNAAKYKIVGKHNGYIQQQLEYQSHLVNELNFYEHTNAILELQDKSVLNNIRRSLALRKVEKQKKLLKSVQDYQREYVMNVVDEVGIKEYGLVVIQFDKNPRNKGWFLKGLKALRIIIDENSYHIKKSEAEKSLHLKPNKKQ